MENSKTKFGFSIRASDKKSVDTVNKVYQHCLDNGLNFSHVVTQAIINASPKYLGDTDETN